MKLLAEVSSETQSYTELKLQRTKPGANQTWSESNLHKIKLYQNFRDSKLERTKVLEI